MSELLSVVIGMLVIVYIGVNGVYMAVSPLGWSRARWTARGAYNHDAIARQVRQGKGWQWRAGGALMGLGALAGALLVISWL